MATAIAVESSTITAGSSTVSLDTSLHLEPGLGLVSISTVKAPLASTATGIPIH